MGEDTLRFQFYETRTDGLNTRKVATSLPCLVPEGWIDDVDPDPAEERRVIVEPPRADRMGTRTGSGSSQR